MKRMEMELRKFRENMRICLPSLQMMVQEMGREVDLQNSLYVTLKLNMKKQKLMRLEEMIWFNRLMVLAFQLN